VASAAVPGIKAAPGGPPGVRPVPRGATEPAVGAVRSPGVRPAVGAGADPEQAADDEAVSAGGRLRTARADLRQQLREQKRLRIATLVAFALLLAGALPLYFAIQAATRDPVLRSLDSLSVPGWAATDVQDRVSGSRWCLIECRFRERTVQSQRPAEQTAPAYEQALASEGWVRWPVKQCPGEKVDGAFTCWRRDELTLDLWVRKPQCTQDPLAQRPTVGPSDGGGAPAAPVDPACAGSVITLKVRNYIDDDRRHRGEPTSDPSLTGEDPNAVFTDAPTPGPT
jgi:hypothetical protein